MGADQGGQTRWIRAILVMLSHRHCRARARDCSWEAASARPPSRGRGTKPMITMPIKAAAAYRRNGGGGGAVHELVGTQTSNASPAIRATKARVILFISSTANTRARQVAWFPSKRGPQV